ncbi:hypothetical protein [Telmatospirillum sp.]|nr:hypothetical protein [Telmatospirillum sp.]MDR3438993.1 hypothetical protein [Telmatospirillum sp.]
MFTRRAADCAKASTAAKLRRDARGAVRRILLALGATKVAANSTI